MQEITFTLHARVRMAQRGITQQDIRFVYRHGRREYANKALFIFLGKRNIPAASGATHGHLEGTTVVLSTDGRCVITTYRNRNNTKRINTHGNPWRRAA